MIAVIFLLPSFIIYILPVLLIFWLVSTIVGAIDRKRHPEKYQSRIHIYRTGPGYAGTGSSPSPQPEKRNPDAIDVEYIEYTEIPDRQDEKEPQ